MEFNDEKLLSITEYEKIAKAYSEALQKQGFKLNVFKEPNEQEIEEIFHHLSHIKSLLFCMGGFLNTSQFYSLNERQIRKFLVIFDRESILPIPPKMRDKTKCFLSFLSHEFALISNLILISTKCNFENEINSMIQQRLKLLSQILSL